MATTIGFPAAVIPTHHSIQAQIDKGLHKFEKILNIPGYIPVISSFSGQLVRIPYGQLEIIAAVAIGALFIAKGLLSHDAQQRDKDINYGLFVATHYTLQGLANIVRGTVESIPFVNMLCIPYDLFDKRVRYPGEAV